MKNRIVSLRAGTAFMAVCALFTLIIASASSNAQSYSGSRVNVYSDEGGSGGANYIGTVYFHYGGQTRSTVYDTNAQAYAYLQWEQDRGRTVSYSNTTGGRCGEKGNPPCKSKNLSLAMGLDPALDPGVGAIMGLIDSVEHQVEDSVLWSKLKSVVLIDDVYALIDSTTEGTLVGTAAYVQLDTGYVVRQIGHTFSTRLEAQIYLDNRASNGALVVYAVP